MEIAMSPHIAAKHTESGFAMMKAVSLPYENFCQVSAPDRVPAPFSTPEVQLSDCVVVDASADSEGYGYIEFYPELGAPLYNSLDGAGTPRLIQSAGLRGRMAWQAQSPEPVLPISCYLSGTTSAGVPITCFQHGPDARITLAPTTGANGFITFTVTYSGVDQYPGVVTITPQVYQANVGWTTIGAGVRLVNGSTTVATFNYPTLIGGVNAVSDLRFQVTNVSDAPYGSIDIFLSWNVGVATPDGNVDIPQNWSVCRSLEWPFLSGLPEVQAFRRIAASLLFTYTGSALLNGGQAACALVPADWSPKGDDPYQSVASLRNDRYDGRLSDGGDVTWRPHSEYDSILQNRQSTNPVSSKIVFGYRFEDLTQASSARIRAFGLFGINSPNPVIGRMTYTPAITPEMAEAVSVYYQTMPAATSNKLHVDMKKLSSMGGKALDMVRTLLSHDAAIASVLTSLGQPEAAAGVLAAGRISKVISNKKKGKVQGKAPQKQQQKAPSKKKKKSQFVS